MKLCVLPVKDADQIKKGDVLVYNHGVIMLQPDTGIWYSLKGKGSEKYKWVNIKGAFARLKVRKPKPFPVIGLAMDPIGKKKWRIMVQDR